MKLSLEEWNLMRVIVQEHKKVDERIRGMRVLYKLADEALDPQDRVKIKW